MVTLKFDEWIKAMGDVNTLKILFYLLEFNPNVTVQDLQKNLSISIEAIKEKLKRLEELKIIVCSESKYSLSQDGRRIVSSIYHDMGEDLPPELTAITV
ncbi:MAG: winged helix-turn-helix domain-containing protein [Candidatus Woesearchaeota archaeon]|nr:winged helix-turn-helix domain-containing protein [Candidatus Woesearchaeota archaeon]